MGIRVALWLGLALVGLIVVNYALDLDGHIFLGRRFVALVDALAFWR